MNKQEQYVLIVAGALEAVECARREENHPRLNQMMIRTMALEASFYPLCPEEFIPLERRKYHRKPVDINKEIYLDFADRRQGPVWRNQPGVAMYALFFLTCLTGAPECYQPDGYVYPHSYNCEADRHQRGLGKLYVCLPIEGVISDDNNLWRASGE